MTENGWPPDTNKAPFVSISLDQCVQVTIPGTTETLWFQKGWPSIIMPAFAADMNWYVESLNNSQGYNDEGTWTNGNSVGSSNHLGATAMDYNWSDHPMGPQVPDEAAGWQWSEIVGGPEEPRIRELLKYYTADDGTQLIWWGNDWDSPHDSMHFQMGYNTYQNPAVQRWIDKNINKDGTSKFKQFKASQRPDALTVLQRATGLSATKCAAILPTLQDGLVRAQCTNKNRIAMFIAQTRHESDNYNTTIEYGQGAGKSYYPYYGRGWIQLTWQSNYQKFGAWAVQQGLISDPNQFVNNPDDVADIKWAGIVSAFFWITPHAGHNPINDDCDNGDVNAVTYTINGGYNGLDKRTAYYQQAVALGDDLLALVETQQDEGDFVPTQEQWDDLVADVKEIRAQLSGDWPQNSNDPKAAADLDKRKAAGDRLTLNDMVVWLKNHVSTHKSPTP